MADIADGTQFSDLPSCLAIDILLRLPLKTLSICWYVRKDWRQLYFSDPYFIRRQLETSNIQFLDKDIGSERKFQFGCIVDEVSTGNLRMETVDFSCKLLHDPKYEWRVVNSCNGLVCLIDNCGPYGIAVNSTVYVCNPILGEWVSFPVPDRCFSALGFSAKNNEYKILLAIEMEEHWRNNPKYEWEIYTLGTEHWRSIKTKENTKPWCTCSGIHFNTFLHGSLHWTNARGRVQSFDFETERFTAFSLPELESAYIDHMSMDVALGVINGCLWASFHNSRQLNNGEMWAMKEYGVDESWTMMLAIRTDWSRYYQHDPPDEVLMARHKELVIYRDDISYHSLLFTLNCEEMLISNYCNSVISYNIKGTMRRRTLADQCIGDVTAYNPSFVSVHDFGRGEQVIRGRDLYDGLIKKLADRAKRLKKKKREKRLKKKTKKKLKKKTKRRK